MANEIDKVELPERLQKYVDELAADTTLNEVNLHDKTLFKSALGAKWARYFYEEERRKKEILDNLEGLKEHVTEQLYAKKKAAILQQSVNDAMIKIEAESLLKKSTQYKNIQKSLQEQEDILRFVAEAKQIISQMTWDIKNAIEILKMEKFA